MRRRQRAKNAWTGLVLPSQHDLTLQVLVARIAKEAEAGNVMSLMFTLKCRRRIAADNQVHQALVLFLQTDSRWRRRNQHENVLVMETVYVVGRRRSWETECWSWCGWLHVGVRLLPQSKVLLLLLPTLHLHSMMLSLRNLQRRHLVFGLEVLVEPQHRIPTSREMIWGGVIRGETFLELIVL